MSENICHCHDCEDKKANELKHLNHPFYATAHDYREDVRKGQILKGAAKYPNPFNPADWTAKELVEHAMQENIDQGHYIYGLFEKIETLEAKNDALYKTIEEYKRALKTANNRVGELNNDIKTAQLEAEYWRQRCIIQFEEQKKVVLGAVPTVEPLTAQDIADIMRKQKPQIMPTMKGTNFDEKI